jgi:hypothetical protein
VADPAELLPLWRGGAGSLCDGEGDGDLLGEGDGLGEGDLLGDGDGDFEGEGDGFGDGDLLGDGEGDDILGDGLGEGGLLGDGDGAALDPLGDGDDAVAAATVLGRTASRIPAAIAPPPAMACALARGRAGSSPL